MANLSFISKNVNGIRGHKKRRNIFRDMHVKKYDVIFLQETYSIESDETVWQSEWGGKIFYSHGSNHSRGTAILFRKGLSVIVNNNIVDNEGRFVILDVTYEGEDYTFINLYGPNRDDVEFFQKVFRLVESIPNDFKVASGDFNLVLDNKLDKRGGLEHAHKNAIEFLKNYMANEGLIDIWREQHTNEFKFTWHNETTSVRLDFFLISETLRNRVVNTDIKASYISDHSMPTLTIAPLQTPRGRAFWKMNNTLLSDEIFVTEINQIIDEEVETDYGSAKLTWEMFKMKFRMKAIEISAKKKKSDTLKAEVLEKRLDRLKHRINQPNLDRRDIVGIQKDIDAVKDEIKVINEKKTNASMFRCKTQWHQFGEKNSAYFFALEKHNYNRKCISKIRNSAGVLITNFQEIMKEQSSFYQKLYREKVITDSYDASNVDRYLNEIKDEFVTKLSQQEQFLLEQEITNHEIFDAIMTLRTGKCPGADGIGVEVYQKFWPKLQTLLVELYREIVEEKLFHTSARQSIISLLDKPNRDLLDLENWRPLCLLNVDYKILAKIVSNRLDTVLPQIIKPYQVGFMKNRHISQLITDLLLLLEFCNKEQVPALLISFDFYKAYDKVNYQGLYKILEFFNFGPHFIDLVCILHTDMVSTVMNNNHWSTWIDIQCGLRQGSPASCGLFLLVAQIIGARISQNPKIEGIHVTEEIEIKLFQYADDLTTPLLFRQSSVDAIFAELDSFRSIVNMKINYNKTQIMRIGSLKNSNAKLYTPRTIQWTNEPINILGIDVHTDISKMSIVSFEKAVEKLKATLDGWRHRPLTVLGRTLVCNTLGASLFVYKMMALGLPPPHLLHEAKKAIVRFIWQGKTSRVRYSKIIQGYGKGGIKLVDLEHKCYSLKSIWIKKLISEECGKVSSILAYHALPIKNTYLWHCNISAKDVKNNFSSSIGIHNWYAWANINFHDPLKYGNECILDQSLWYNSWIRRKNKYIVSPGLLEKGVLYVRSIFSEELKRFYTYQEFITKYGQIMDFVKYNSLVSLIPKPWIQMLKGRVDQPEIAFQRAYRNNTTILMEEGRPSTVFYWQLVDVLDNGKEAFAAWARDLNLGVADFTEQKWQKICQLGFKISLSVKLRSFQYRLLQRWLTTNLIRSRWDSQVDPRCYFCHNEIENATHLLWHCSHVQKFWKALFRWLKYICQCNTDTRINAQAIIFNNVIGKDKDFINTIILITKQYIYSVKCRSKNLNMIELVVSIKSMERIEKEIARQNGQLRKHELKWSLLQNAM